MFCFKPSYYALPFGRMFGVCRLRPLPLPADFMISWLRAVMVQCHVLASLLLPLALVAELDELRAFFRPADDEAPTPGEELRASAALGPFAAVRLGAGG